MSEATHIQQLEYLLIEHHAKVRHELQPGCRCMSCFEYQIEIDGVVYRDNEAGLVALISSTYEKVHAAATGHKPEPEPESPTLASALASLMAFITRASEIGIVAAQSGIYSAEEVRLSVVAFMVTVPPDVAPMLHTFVETHVHAFMSQHFDSSGIIPAKAADIVH